MSNEEMKYKIIEQIVDWLVDSDIEPLYEFIVNGDYDYIPNLFVSTQDFEDFIEKYKNDCKCGKND